MVRSMNMTRKVGEEKWGYDRDMGKKYIILVFVLLVLALAGGGYYYWKTRMQQKPATDVVSPIVVPITTPVESVQDANPYDKTNPFSNIKVNPFE